MLTAHFKLRLARTGTSYSTTHLDRREMGQEVESQIDVFLSCHQTQKEELSSPPEI